jgi:hypothetical protein
MWRRVFLVSADVSEESVISISRVERIHELETTLALTTKLIPSTLKMEATHSSEMLATTWRHITEDGLLHNQNKKNSVALSPRANYTD